MLYPKLTRSVRRFVYDENVLAGVVRRCWNKFEGRGSCTSELNSAKIILTKYTSSVIIYEIVFLIGAKHEQVYSLA